MLSLRGKNKRHYVRSKSTHFFIGFIACLFSFHAKGKGNTTNEANIATRFSWNEHRTLSWSDFKGPVDAQSDESAAATCCAIGFRLGSNDGGHPEVTVYNTFYINKSWVREDARIESILVHEQGHFDLCELFTRKLRARTSTVNLSSPTVKQELMDIYAALNNEYETCQQNYERETMHGTIIPEQQKWQEKIANELNELQQPS